MRQIRLAQRPKPLCSIFNRRHGGHMRNWVGPPLSGVHCGSDRMFGPWGTYVTTGAFGKFASGGICRRFVPTPAFNRLSEDLNAVSQGSSVFLLHP